MIINKSKPTWIASAACVVISSGTLVVTSTGATVSTTPAVVISTSSTGAAVVSKAITVGAACVVAATSDTSANTGAGGLAKSKFKGSIVVSIVRGGRVVDLAIGAKEGTGAGSWTRTGAGSWTRTGAGSWTRAGAVASSRATMLVAGVVDLLLESRAGVVTVVSSAGSSTITGSGSMRDS